MMMLRVEYVFFYGDDHQYWWHSFWNLLIWFDAEWINEWINGIGRWNFNYIINFACSLFLSFSSFFQHKGQGDSFPQKQTWAAQCLSGKLKVFIFWRQFFLKIKQIWA